MSRRKEVNILSFERWDNIGRVERRIRGQRWWTGGSAGLSVGFLKTTEYSSHTEFGVTFAVIAGLGIVAMFLNSAKARRMRRARQIARRRPSNAERIPNETPLSQPTPVEGIQAS